MIHCLVLNTSHVYLLDQTFQRHSTFCRVAFRSHMRMIEPVVIGPRMTFGSLCRFPSFVARARKTFVINIRNGTSYSLDYRVLPALYSESELTTT